MAAVARETPRPWWGWPALAPEERTIIGTFGLHCRRHESAYRAHGLRVDADIGQVETLVTDIDDRDGRRDHWLGDEDFLHHDLLSIVTRFPHVLSAIWLVERVTGLCVRRSARRHLCGTGRIHQFLGKLLLINPRWHGLDDLGHFWSFPPGTARRVEPDQLHR
jgi:hypothetical protein